MTELRRTSDDINAIYDEVFSSDYNKKRLLDKAISKYINDQAARGVITEQEANENHKGDGETSKDTVEKSRKNSKTAVLESFFKNIIENWSCQMILTQYT
ncbi:9278_t:CDS:2 [Funneliformis caledonium]|uniref:9278_t:CDS:1 n=1 Tax=Funneliformis caledonium TaxID=1117310 RepID=A0A9N9DVA4_9GLOM|nr:9278_t:CDS:2 [Funneliformis caledonium]